MVVVVGLGKEEEGSLGETVLATLDGGQGFALFALELRSFEGRFEDDLGKQVEAVRELPYIRQ